jgi:ribosome biogenesis protein MAK21
MERKRDTKKTKAEPIGEDQMDAVSESDAEEAEIWEVCASCYRYQRPNVLTFSSKAMKKSVPPAEDAGADPDDDSDGLPDPYESTSDADSNIRGKGDEEDSSDGDSSESQTSSAHSDVARMSKGELEKNTISSDEALEFGENSDDVLDSDVQVDDSLVDGLIHFSSDDEPWQGIGEKGLGKRKRKTEGGGERKKKRRLKDLPLFASLEDYERLIDAPPEDHT